MSKDKIGMDQLMNQFDVEIPDLSRGSVLEGKIISTGEKEALVDLGGKAEGVLPLGEVDKPSELDEGDEILVYVITPRDRRGQILLSARRAKTANAWEQLEESLKGDTVLSAQLVGFNKGGGLVDVLGLEGFVPFSHLSSRPSSDLPPEKFEEALEELVGEEIEVKVLDLDRYQRKVILSEKAALQKQKEEKEKGVLKELEEGDVVEVEVKEVMPFGLLVGLEGIDALIRTSELFWEDKKDPLSQFEKGEQFKAKVLSLPQDLTGRAKLSRKRIQKDPWVVLEEDLEAGEEIEGKVTKIASFGVVVELDQGVEGLIPLSELDEEEGINVGSRVKLEIREIDKEERRLELGLSK